MEENWNEQNQPKTYGEESQMYESGQQTEPDYNNQPNYNQQQGCNQPNYNQQQSYNQPNYGQPNYNQPNNAGYYNAPQPQHGPVKDIFCYILLIIMPLRLILSWIMSGRIFSGMDYESILDGSYMAAVAEPGYMAASMISSLIGIAFLVFIILDIVEIHKQNYKITGLILFAILLNPGYYIWRSYVLGRKKTFPIIYTIVYSLLMVSYWIYTFFTAFQMAFGMMQMM